MKKFLYYALNLTWGIPLNIIGGIVALVMLGNGHNPRRHGGCLYFEIGEGWGGVNFGLVFLCDCGSSDSLKSHEFGHSIQNCMWGFLTPFVVHLPSAVRYWVREWKARHGANLQPYDAVWFEGQATRLGEKYLRCIEWNQTEKF